MDAKALRRRMVLAPTPRERERWYAMLLLAQGWTAAATAEALERGRHLKAVVVVLNWLASWKEELKRRCRTVLQSSVYASPAYRFPSHWAIM